MNNQDVVDNNDEELFKKRINVRKKGKVGELEFVSLLVEKGYEARRSGNQAGDRGQAAIFPDIIDNSPFAWEVKRVEGGINPYKMIEQSEKNAGDKIPAVAYRKNGKRWLAVVYVENLLELIKEQ